MGPRKACAIWQPSAESSKRGASAPRSPQKSSQDGGVAMGGAPRGPASRQRSGGVLQQRRHLHAGELPLLPGVAAGAADVFRPERRWRLHEAGYASVRQLSMPRFSLLPGSGLSPDISTKPSTLLEKNS